MLAVAIVNRVEIPHAHVCGSNLCNNLDQVKVALSMTGAERTAMKHQGC
jgi:hypothetical protein